MYNGKIIIKEAEASLMKEQYKFKIVIVGDSGVGKTNLVKRFLQNSFSLNTQATVGCEFFSNNYYINDKLFKIEIWDTAGQERYKSITSAYYKGASGAILVYDVSNKTSFNNVDRWYQEIKECSSENIQIVMIGNKTDLTDDRVISKEKSISKASELNIPVMETSALSATNVKEAFYLMIKEIYKLVIGSIKENEINNNEYNIIGSGIDLNNNNNNNNKRCCF